MDALIAKAQELGRLLAEHKRFEALIAARDAVRKDAAASKLLRDYDAKAQHIHALLAQGKPVEVADKRTLSELEQQMASNESLKTMARAQADFSEMMSKINRAIYDKIAPAGEPSEKGE